MPRGIIKCYLRINNGPVMEVSKGIEILLNDKDTNEFFVDETCMDAGTVNKKASAENARWAFIYNGFFDQVQKSNDTSLWANLSGGQEPIAKWGINTRYKVGKSLKFAPSGSGYYFGYKQRVELFSFSPGSGFFFYVVPVRASNIVFAYFRESERVRRYGETINLQVCFHGYNQERGKQYETKLYLLEKEKAVGLGETEEFEENNLWKKVIYSGLSHGTSTDDYNIRVNHQFPIDIEWKKNENKQKEFTVAVEVYQKTRGRNGKDSSVRVAYKNFATEPTKDLMQYNYEVLKLEDVDNKPSESSRFIVSDELMDHYLKRIEAQKNNLIQYIGDVPYSRKEFDPCGFSTITVKSGDDQTVIFNEDDTSSIDHTDKTFDLIVGDTRKEISIKLGKLTTKGVKCDGILLPAGQTHAEQKNVFQMDRVIPGLRLYNNIFVTMQGQSPFVRVPDQSQAGDTDVTADTSRPPSADVSEMQDWQLNRDYKFNGEDEVILMLKYFYNKTFLEKQQAYVSGGSNQVVNSLWLFNYFILSEQVAQTYFVPISTCRYTNQLAKVRIFPDIEWEIAFMVTVGRGYSGKLRYERQRMEGYHRGFDFKYLKDDLHIEATQTSNLGWALKGKAVENGTEHTLGLENVKKSIDTAIYAFDMVYQGLQVLNPEGGRGQSAAVSKRVIQIDFAIDPPNIGFALGWKFGPASTKQIVPVYTGGLRADPLIGLTISVDLVPLAGKIPYVGPIISAIISVIEYLSDSDIYITFEVANAVKLEMSLAYNKIDGFKNGGKQKFEIEVNITIKAGCKSNEVVMIPTVTRGGVTETTEMEKWKVEGALGTTFTFTEEVGFDSENSRQYKQSKVVWNPAHITITCYELILSKVTYNPSFSRKMKLFDEKTLYDSGKKYIDEK